MKYNKPAKESKDKILNTQLEVRYRSSISEESDVNYKQESAGLFYANASLYQVNEETKSGTTLFNQSVQKETYMKEELNRHGSKSKSIDFNLETKCNTEYPSNPTLKSVSQIDDQHIRGELNTDTLALSQNQSFILSKDETVKLVLDNMKELKDLIIQQKESDRQKASREEELKRQNDEKQLMIEALEKEKEIIKLELQELIEQNAKFEVLEEEKSERIFERSDNSNIAVTDDNYARNSFPNNSKRCVFDEHYPGNLMLSKSLTHDPQIFRELSESSSNPFQSD